MALGTARMHRSHTRDGKTKPLAGANKDSVRRKIARKIPETKAFSHRKVTLVTAETPVHVVSDVTRAYLADCTGVTCLS